MASNILNSLKYGLKQKYYDNISYISKSFCESTHF